MADIRGRIAKAESERDHWRSAGRQDKYYQAYFLVNALQVQLHRLQRQVLEPAPSNERDIHPTEVAVVSPGPAPSPIRPFFS